MSTRVIAALLTLSWTLAAVTIWMSGRHVERSHRYDGCTYVANLGPRPFWACPAESDPPAEPTEAEPGSTA
jgi:hypothetical protein